MFDHMLESAKVTDGQGNWPVVAFACVCVYVYIDLYVDIHAA